MITEASSDQRAALRWLLLGLAAAALVTLSPLWVSLVLSAWFAALTRPFLEKLTRGLGGRPRAAAVLTVGLLLLLLIPLVLVAISLGSGAVEFVQSISSSPGRTALMKLVSDRPASGELPKLGIDNIISLLQQHGAKAWGLMQFVASKAATSIVGLFIFLLGCYSFLVHGPRFTAWLMARLPITPTHTRRLAAAFFETGRGLLVGVGLTGLVQGIIATITYLALSIPSALVLGLLTAVASIIPPVGTALVWVPVAVGLALHGRWAAMSILVVVGFLVIGLVDNLLRPIFSRYGRLKLPTFVLFLSIFGGLALYGAAGILLGPLLVRLGVEALEIAHDEDLTRRKNGAEPAPPNP